MDLPIRDRQEAGRQLATMLSDLRNREDVLVLGLPRGGVPVAYEVATALRAPLDVYIVRKLGVPGHEELAMGAIASGDVRVLNDEVIDGGRIPQASIDTVTAAARRELNRQERLFRGDRPLPDIRDRTVVFVDDGLATGSTMRAAIQAIRQLDPREVIVAVPVAAPSICQAFEQIADRIVCGATPESFVAIGPWYTDFTPTSDDDVRSLLAKAARPRAASGDGHTATEPRARGVFSSLSEAVAAQAQPLTGQPQDYDRLLDEIGEARFVLIGESTHGTEEFYRERSVITRRLIEERGFHAVAVEADWPTAFRVNRYVRNYSDDQSPDEALSDFQRFPTWMWRNTVMDEFVGWLRDHNSQRSRDTDRVGFYGLDLYSLTASVEAVISYLDSVDPEAAERARDRYDCFGRFADNEQAYGYAASLGVTQACEDDVVNQLVELQRRASDLAVRDGQFAADEFFSAEQNARLAKNAEAYYRTMFRGHISSWNLRDTHMADTLDELIGYLGQRTGEPAKIVVWAHNSHLGDARATQIGDAGEVNLGQLTRERHGKEAFLIGQTTYQGTVTAASDWDEPGERKRVRAGLEGSCEALFHEVAVVHESFLLSLRDSDTRLRLPRLQRAIGVVYKPETERLSHYFDVRLAEQFDAVIHQDTTTALRPLDPTELWHHGELPETFPFSGQPLPGRRAS